MREETFTLKELMEITIILFIPALFSLALGLVALRLGGIRIDYFGVIIVITPEICMWSALLWSLWAILGVSLAYYEPYLEEKIKGKESYLTLISLVILISFGLFVCYKIEEVEYGVVYTTEDYMKILIIAISLIALITIAHIVNEKLKRKKEGEKR